MSDRPMGAVVQYLRELVRPAEEGEPTDSQLLEQFTTRKDERAFAALMLRHGPMVQGVCQRLLHHVQDAEDVFQATFLILARKSACIRKQASLASWLYGVAHRLARKTMVADARRRARERKAGSMATPDFVAEAARRELRAVLDEEISRLPERFRTPLILCYLEGKTQNEAAHLLGRPSGSMSWHLAQAMERLRDRLGRRGLTPLAAGAFVLGAEELSPAIAAPLLARTLQAALLVAGGKAAPLALVSPRALAMARTLFGNSAFYLKVLGATFLLFIAIGAGATMLLRNLFAPPASAALTADFFRDPVKQPAKPPAKKQQTQVWRLRSTFIVSPGSVRLLALVPGGKQVATLGSPKEEIGKVPAIEELLAEIRPKLWDTTTGKKQKVYSEQQAMGQVSCLAIAPDGKTLATAELGVVLWNVATGHVKATFTEPVSVASVVFAPDGKTLAFARADGVVRFCDLGKGILTTLPHTFAALSHMAFSAEGKRLITVGFDGKLQIWSVARAALVATRQAGQAIAPRVLSPDGKIMVSPVPTPGDPSLQLWDVDTGKLQATLVPENEPGWINALAFAPDGKTLAVGSSEGSVTLWNLTARKETVRLGGLKGRVTALGFSPDGHILAGGDPEGTVKVWQLKGRDGKP